MDLDQLLHEGLTDLADEAEPRPAQSWARIGVKRKHRQRIRRASVASVGVAAAVLGGLLVPTLRSDDAVRVIPRGTPDTVEIPTIPAPPSGYQADKEILTKNDAHCVNTSPRGSVLPCDLAEGFWIQGFAREASSTPESHRYFSLVCTIILEPRQVDDPSTTEGNRDIRTMTVNGRPAISWERPDDSDNSDYHFLQWEPRDGVVVRLKSLARGNPPPGDGAALGLRELVAVAETMRDTRVKVAPEVRTARRTLHGEVVDFDVELVSGIPGLFPDSWQASARWGPEALWTGVFPGAGVSTVAPKVAEDGPAGGDAGAKAAPLDAFTSSTFAQLRNPRWVLVMGQGPHDLTGVSVAPNRGRVESVTVLDFGPGTPKVWYAVLSDATHGTVTPIISGTKRPDLAITRG